MKEVFITVLTAAVAWGALLTNAQAAESELAQKCEQYAKEDGVSAEELDSYIQDCIQSLAPDAETESSSPDQPAAGG